MPAASFISRMGTVDRPMNASYGSLHWLKHSSTRRSMSRKLPVVNRLSRHGVALEGRAERSTGPVGCGVPQRQAHGSRGGDDLDRRYRSQTGIGGDQGHVMRYRQLDVDRVRQPHLVAP